MRCSPRQARGRAKQPHQEIDVMATLRQQTPHVLFVAPPPIAADMAVREMPVAHGFGVFDTHDFADDLVFNEEFVEEDVVRAVPEDVADRDDFGRVLGKGVLDGEAVFEREGEGLFAKDV